MIPLEERKEEDRVVRVFPIGGVGYSSLLREIALFFVSKQIEREFLTRRDIFHTVGRKGKLGVLIWEDGVKGEFGAGDGPHVGGPQHGWRGRWSPPHTGNQAICPEEDHHRY